MLSRVFLPLSLGIAWILTVHAARADVFFVSNYVSKTVQKVTSGGAVSTFASPSSGPSGLAFDATGNLFVNANGSIMKYTPGGAGSLFATAGSPYAGGLAFDGSGNLYATGFSSGTVERFTPTGTRSVFANTNLSEPYALAFDRSGNLFVTNDGVYSGGVNGTVAQISITGVSTLYATGLSDPQGLAFDGAGNLYVAETLVGSSYTGIIERFTPSGGRSVFANLGASIDPLGLAFDSQGNLYAAVENQNNGTYMIDKFTANGIASIFAMVASNPIALAVTTDAGVPLKLPSTVPEPTTWAFLSLSAVALGFGRRHRAARSLAR